MTSTRNAQSILTLRPASAADAADVSRLAQLDSAPIPDGALLLALIDDRPMAALSLETGAVVADPFSPTADLVAMLRGRAANLREAGAGGRTRGTRTPFRRSGAGAVPWARFG